MQYSCGSLLVWCVLLTVLLMDNETKTKALSIFWYSSVLCYSLDITVCVVAIGVVFIVSVDLQLTAMCIGRVYTVSVV